MARTVALPGLKPGDYRALSISNKGVFYLKAEGDPDGNGPPNTSFENLPDDWVCPICGATKDQFSPVD